MASDGGLTQAGGCRKAEAFGQFAAPMRPCAHALIRPRTRGDARGFFFLRYTRSQAHA